MLRYYQKALKGLQTSRGGHEAAGKVEQLNLLHSEQVQNGEHSVSDGGSRKHPKHKRKGEKERREMRKTEELETVHHLTTFIEAATLEYSEQLKYNQNEINGKAKKRHLSVGDEVANTNGDNSCETQAQKRRSGKRRRKKKKKLRRGHTSGFSEGTVKKRKKHSDSEIVSDTEKRKKKKKLKIYHQSEFSEGTNTNKRKSESSKQDVSSEGVSSHSNALSTDSPGEVSQQPNHKKRKRDKRKEDMSENRTVHESVVNGQDHETRVIERMAVELNIDKAKVVEAIKDSDEIQKTLNISKKRRTKLREEGITFRKGKWSSQELKLLRHNMAQFLECHDISDPTKLLFASRHLDSDEMSYWTRFVRETQFYKELGKGIQRPVIAIYQCARRIYDEKNYVGKYTESELQELKRLVKVHGSDWVGISAVMDRSTMSLNRKYAKLVKGEENRGTWTEEEVQRLNEAVHYITNTSEGEAVYHDIYWPAVSQMVKTRGPDKCRQKWLDKLCWSMNDKKVQRWRRSDDIKLVTSLYESGCVEEFDVDWMDIQSAFETKYSPHFLYEKYSKLKKRVPNYQMVNFEDIVDYLYRLFVSAEEEAEGQRDNGLSSDETE